MPTFKERYEELVEQFLRRDDTLVTAMSRAITQIQNEVRMYGHTYEWTLGDLYTLIKYMVDPDSNHVYTSIEMFGEGVV